MVITLNKLYCCGVTNHNFIDSLIDGINSFLLYVREL